MGTSNLLGGGQSGKAPGSEIWVKPKREAGVPWACGKERAFQLEGTRWAEPWKQARVVASCV